MSNRTAPNPAVRRRSRHQSHEQLSQWGLYLLVFVFLFLTFVPVYVMLSMSFKDNSQIYTNFWGLPDPWRWSNYEQGFKNIGHYTFNTVINSVSSTVLVVLLASLSGYVFARHRFPGKEYFYFGIVGLLAIPGILTLIPAFVTVRQLGIWNTAWALILTWTSGGQVIGIFLARSFIAGLPEELFEAGRIDGATEFQLWYMVAVPLSWPILMTIAILHMVGAYNDFLWPLLVIGDDAKQVVSVGLTQFTSSFGVTEYGPQMAANVIASIPLLILFLFGMKYFIRGITSGAIKG